MSTEKKTVDGKDVIRMYFVTSELLEIASQEASKRAASNPESEFSILELTEDEQDYILQQINDGMNDLFEVVNRLIAGALTHDTSYTPQGGVAADTTYIDLIDNGEYKTAQLTWFDKAVKSGLVHYILSKWYENKGQVNDAKVHLSSYARDLSFVERRSLPLRKV